MAKRLSWAVMLERAGKRGKFTQIERDYASSWMTCAVSERHHWSIDVEHMDEWYETREYEAGIEFLRAVNDDDIPAAKRLYAEIMAL